jgi:hypothetical protein
MLGGIEILGELVVTFLVVPILETRVGCADVLLVFAFCALPPVDVSATGCADVLATGEAVEAGDINPPPALDTGWKNKKAVRTLPAAAIKNTVRFIIPWLLRYFLMLLREMISNRLMCK